MKTLANLLASLILATWVVGVAILSVQNATLVSLKFLTFQSIRLPVGIVLAFSAGAGVVGGAIALPLVNNSDDQLENDSSEDRVERERGDDDDLSKGW